ncbi:MULTISPECIES: DMT family transporter [Ramlibacter]|uniref:EamA/RhaT family transporter n=1 Tax=Ramlibacter pinisoli TaxID=2682844 RepID=A0A6N8IT24_9BURK|nr:MULTISPECIES: DMT family transporter [Ramlibacter]MBA2964057.1 DMT family transporter [Ramlibacter sp. CGMCC 1.13660]MVQ29023.1 EamA/RhaT family transporter [Ramlibacter pinisoli]
MPTAATLAWIWVPIAIFAALVQTARNAAQRSLVAQAGTLGATLARFLYGLPFALAWVLLLHAMPATAAAVPHFHAAYFGWLLLGAISQLAATACLLAAMKQRNFVIGVAYSKTDALQVALFGALFLHELPGWPTLTAMALATVGVVLLSLPRQSSALQDARSWAGSAALWGLASGAGFAMSAVGYRGAALELPQVSPWLAGAWGVLWAQAAQSLLLGGWLAWRAPASLRAIAGAWRVSTVAGAAGALASIGWFTAFALTTAANVRTLGLIEVVFSYLVSHRLLREKLSSAEAGGLALVVAGLLAMFTTL